MNNKRFIFNFAPLHEMESQKITKKNGLKIIICTIPEPKPEARAFWSNPTQTQSEPDPKSKCPTRQSSWPGRIVGKFSTAWNCSVWQRFPQGSPSEPVKPRLEPNLPKEHVAIFVPYRNRTCLLNYLFFIEISTFIFGTNFLVSIIKFQCRSRPLQLLQFLNFMSSFLRRKKHQRFYRWLSKYWC